MTDGKVINIAVITCGHSQFVDSVWGWLGENSSMFEELGCCGCGYDFWKAWGLLVVAGCTITHLTGEGVEGISIEFNGEVEELIDRLNRLKAGMI